jgi:hypothetical protein
VISGCTGIPVDGIEPSGDELRSRGERPSTSLPAPTGHPTRTTRHRGRCRICTPERVKSQFSTRSLISSRPSTAPAIVRTLVNDFGWSYHDTNAGWPQSSNSSCSRTAGSDLFDSRCLSCLVHCPARPNCLQRQRSQLWGSGRRGCASIVESSSHRRMVITGLGWYGVTSRVGGC